jgi:hypothetical protein
MLIDLTKPATDRELRWFAGLWFPALCAVLGWFALDKAPTLAAGVWVLGAVLGLIGLVRPRAIRPVYTGLTRLTFPIGWVVSHALLLVMYFGIITPVGLLVRLFRDPLDRSFDARASTYWAPRDTAAPHRYFRQF